MHPGKGVSGNEASSRSGSQSVQKADAGIMARLAGLHFRTGDADALLSTIECRLDAHRHTVAGSMPAHNLMVGFLNPHVFNQAALSTDVQRFLQRADRLCIDGVGVKLAALLLHRQWLPRVVAEHLFEALLMRPGHAASAILIGGHPDVTPRAVQAMEQASSRLRFVDFIDGYRPLPDYRDFLQRNRQCPLIFIAAGTPASEQIALLADTELRSAVILLIGGGTLNTWAGSKKRGPRWISAIGMEWLHRVIHEPHTRRRYSRGGLDFIRNLSMTWPQAPSPVRESDT